MTHLSKEISIVDVFIMLKKRWLLIVSMVISFLIIGAIYVVLSAPTPVYQSTLTFLIDYRSNPEGIITESDIQYSKMLANTYSSIVDTPAVLEDVVKTLDLNMTPEQLTYSVSISPVGSNPILKIAVNDTNPILARDIAKEVMNVFSKKLIETTKYDSTSVLEDAKISNIPINQSSTKTIVFIGLIGFMLSVSLVFLLEYLDRTIKSPDQLEELFNIPVLGSIPEVKKVK